MNPENSAGQKCPKVSEIRPSEDFFIVQEIQTYHEKIQN